MAFNKIEVFGDCDVNYVWSKDNKLTEAEIETMSQNGIHSPEWDYNSIALATFNDSLSASSFENEDIVGYRIQRKNIKDNVMKTVAEVGGDNTGVVDFNIANNATYKYYITPVLSKDNETVLGQTVETDELNTSWDSWSIIGLKEVGEKQYEIDNDNIWVFHLNLEAGDYKPVYSKTFVNGFGRFPKGFSGETNYLKGSLSCYVGAVNKFGDYDNDDANKDKKWREFCNNGDLKLLRDLKGNVFLVDIEDTTQKIESYANDMPTKLSFNFIQLGDADDICAYEVV